MKPCPSELLWKPDGRRVRVKGRPLVRRPSWLRRLPPGDHQLELVEVLRIEMDGAWIAVGNGQRKTLAPVFVRNPF